jgi:hypothetical protein
MPSKSRRKATGRHRRRTERSSSSGRTAVITGLRLDPLRKIRVNGSVLVTFSLLQPWATNLLSGLIGALVGGALSFFGGVRGARIAARTATDLQKKEFAARDQAAEVDEQRLIRGTVQSISDEIEALWRQYYKEIGPHLSSIPEKEAARPFPVHQSYFVIFDASGGLLGRLPVGGLRSKILDFYFGAKAMVDSLQYYSNLRAYYFTLIQGHPNVVATWNEILFYTEQLRLMHLELERLYKEVRPELEKYLTTTPSNQIVYPSSTT